eukprot:1466336-Pyramimonas_sp.AAC.1
MPCHRHDWPGVFFANQQSLPREQDPVSVNTLHGLYFSFSSAFASVLVTALTRLPTSRGLSWRRAVGIRGSGIGLLGGSLVTKILFCLELGLF